MLLFQCILFGIRPRAGGLNGMDSRLQPALDLIGGGNDERLTCPDVIGDPWPLDYRSGPGMTSGCHPRRDRGSMRSWIPGLGRE
jgi:hypothetical protein